MTEDMTHWQPRERPARMALAGHYVDILPLSCEDHAEHLYDASKNPDSDAKFRWLYENPPTTLDNFRDWMRQIETSEDPLFFVVIDKATGKVAGRQSLMRMDPANGAIEIGNIYWGPLAARKPGATEALFLMAKYVFEDLGYRRFEWKCNNDNQPSKAAARRFGFQYEGTFRQHMVAKGLNRDTAWFSMIDKEWPALRSSFEAWLSTLNFDAEGFQRKRLEEFR